MPKNLREYSSKTKKKMVIGFFILLFTVGLGLIWILYGRNSALTGLICLMGLLIPIGVIYLILTIIEFFVKKKQD